MRRWTLATLAVVALAASLAPARGNDSSAWQGIATAWQADGPVAVLERSRAALRADPTSLALLWQHTDILLAVGGPAGVRNAMQSFAAEGLAVDSAAVAFSVAMETGNTAVATSRFSAIEAPPSGTLDGLLHGFAAVRLALGSRGGLHHADSLMTVLSSHPMVGGAVLEAWRDELRMRILQSRGDAEGARAQAVQQIQRAQAGQLRVLSARLALAQGRIDVFSGRPSEAEALFSHALRLSESIGHTRYVSLAASWRGFAFERLGRYNDSMADRVRAADMLRAQDDPNSLAYCQLGLGWVAWQAGDPALAVTAGREAAELFRRLGNKWAEAQSLLNLGIIFENTDRLDDARPVLERALASSLAGGNPQQQSAIRNSMGVMYWRMGRPDLAVPVYEEVLAENRARGDVQGEQQVLNNLALANEQMGQEQQARVLFRQCIDRATEAGGDDAAARLNLGRLLYDGEHYAQAETNVLAGLAHARRTGDVVAEADALETLGRIYFKQGRPEDALLELREADRQLLRMNRNASRFTALIRMEIVLRTMGRLDEAMAVLDTVERIADELHHEQFVAVARCERGAVLLEQREPERARAELQACAATWQFIQERGLEVDEHIRNLGLSTAIVRTLDTVKPGENEDAAVAEAFDMLQQLKARTVLDFVRSGQRKIRPDLPDSLLTREWRARDRAASLARAMSDAEGERADSLRSALAETEAAYQSARRAILDNDERYRRAATVQAANLSEVRSDLLEPGTLILDFMVGYEPGDPEPRPVLLFALDASGLTVHRLNSFRALRAQMELVIDLLNSPPGGSAGGDALRAATAALSNAILKPVAWQLSTNERVMVSTDGFLHELPFAALPMPGPDAKGYLVENITVTTYPSLTAAVRRREAPAMTAQRKLDFGVFHGSGGEREDSTGLAQAMGRAEVDAIASSFKRVEVFRVGVETAAAAALAESGVLENTRVVHFAAHGYFDDRQPWRSGLYLAGTGAGGKLEIADVYHLRFDCDLVTLAACETARGQVSPLNGLQGFAQALQGSGAGSVLATLWPIDDAIARVFLMRFYDNLASGMTRAGALREAQLSFIGEAALRHPFYWAPFVLAGEMDEGIALSRRPPRRQVGVLAALAAALMLILAVVVWRRAT